MGNGATDISIIIVNYRVKEYVALLLDSIQKPSFPTLNLKDLKK